jgi:hypothetical protein
VKATEHEGLVFRRDDKLQGAIQFLGFVDADYAPDYGDAFKNHKSTTGYVFTINGVAFSWRSCKQTVVADSTTASEFLAAGTASKQTVWLRRLFLDLGYPQHGPTILYEDNQACEKLVKNYCGHDKIKHLDIRASIIREHHEKEFFIMHLVRTEDQLADMFTKVMPRQQQQRLRAWMLRGEIPHDCMLFAQADVVE